MTFYKWAGKLLKRNGKFAIAKSCCCEQWYCVLTQSGDYECRDARPDPSENAQVLSDHKTEKDCQKECYERYYCIDDNGDYRCVKESDLPDDADIISGPQRQEECEEKCENCPPCGDKACEAAATGDDTIIEDCCFNLADEEQWTFNGTDWELTQRCGNDERTPCKGRPVPSFPQGLNAGDVFTVSCVPNGKTPDDNPDCEKCLYSCDKTSTPYACVPEPDNGKYTEKECAKECEGLWYCTSETECERQNPPQNPAKKGFETERECLDSAEDECSPAGVVWVCLVAGGCAKCYFDEAPGVPPNTTGKPDCSSLPPHYSDSYATEAQCDSRCLKDVTCWDCLSGGVCGPSVYNTPGGVCPPFSYPTQALCQSSCNNPLP